MMTTATACSKIEDHDDDDGDDDDKSFSTVAATQAKCESHQILIGLHKIW